jgi:hypothetical protein
MRNFLISSAAILASTAGGSMAADGRDPFAGSDPVMSDTIRTGLEAAGYRVERMKIEHGRYEARVVNDSGLPVKAVYDAHSGELLRAKLR